MRAAWRRRAALAALALAFTALDAGKPLHIDDPYYVRHAQQVLRAPLDPYGFLVFWHERPEPANQRVAPPVLFYWLAPAVAAWPDRPWAWKLWLLPFVIALVLALDALLRRFAPGLESPLVVLTVASPALLPSLNLMLDIPALALGLVALVCFLAASDALDAPGPPERARAAALLWTVAAGLVGGVAAETKFTALTVPGVWLAWAVLHRRWRLWVVATAIVVALFTAWEAFIALSYGWSHFVLQGVRFAAPLSEKLSLVPVLPGIVLPAAPGLVLLALTVLAARLRDRGTRGSGALSAPSAGSDRWFLLAWLGIEALGYVAISPFPAVRRVFGLLVPATVLLGHLATRVLPDAPRRRWAWAAAAVSAAAGLAVFTVDLLEARAEQQAAVQAADWLAARDPAARPFFAGHWGFDYYAERAGLRRVVAGRFRLRTPLRAGDWLVVPSARVNQQQIALDLSRLELAHEVVVADPVPLATVPGYYSGITPVSRLDGPRVSAAIYRVTGDFQP